MKFIILFFSFLYLTVTSMAQSKRTILTVSGELTNEAGSKLKDFTVLIIDNKTNDVLDEFAYNNSSNFSFHVPIGGDYTVTFHKKGYLKKQIIINTETKHYFWKNPHYEFVALLPRKINKNMGPQLINKPVVRISYNERRKQFDYDQLYTNKMESELSKISSREKEIIVKKLEKQLEADSIHNIASTPIIKTNPTILSEEKTISTKEVASEVQNKTDIQKENIKPFVKENIKKDNPLNNTSLNSTAESLQIKSDQRAVEIEKKEVEDILHLNKNEKTTDAFAEFKTYEEIINSRFTRIDYTYVKEKEVVLNNKLNESIKAKYETSNRLTSLLDNIDEYEKTQRMKMFHKK